jgi:O-antigen/teichoic acid export membrane protein
LPDVANSSLLPVLSRFYHENEKKWVELGRLLNKTLLLLGLPIALIFFVYAECVIQFLYGSEAFAPAVPIMRAAAMIILIRFAWEAYGLMLTTSGRQFEKMIIVVIATIVMVALNAYAIPAYGIYGAVMVSILVNLFVAAAFAWSVRSFFIQWTLDARFLLPGILTMISAIVLWNTNTLSLSYSILVTLAFYAFISYFVGYTKDERRLVFFGGGKKEGID